MSVDILLVLRGQRSLNREWINELDADKQQLMDSPSFANAGTAAVG
jgi:hypothetical protein